MAISKTDQRWLAMQRENYRKGKLTSKQIAKLEKIPGWEWNPYGNHRSLEEKVKRAEKMVEELGYFPQLKELIESGDEDIYHGRKRCPEAFAHLPKAQQKFFSKMEYRDLALHLCKENKGKLPSTSRLNDMKQYGLLQTIFKNPDLFSDISRDNEAVRFDKNFTKNFKDLRKAYNTGSLSSAQRGTIGQLRKRYKGGLLSEEQIKTVEKGFNGWFWTSDRRLAEDYLPLANKLSKNKTKPLPNHCNLIKMGHGAFAQILIKRPGVFKDFKKASLVKTIEEHIAFAEKWAKDHSGLLATNHWFIKNGHSGFAYVMAKNPDLFSHIPREPKKGSWVNR